MYADLFSQALTAGFAISLRGRPGQCLLEGLPVSIHRVAGWTQVITGKRPDVDLRIRVYLQARQVLHVVRIEGSSFWLFLLPEPVAAVRNQITLSPERVQAAAIWPMPAELRACTAVIEAYRQRLAHRTAEQGPPPPRVKREEWVRWGHVLAGHAQVARRRRLAMSQGRTS